MIQFTTTRRVLAHACAMALILVFHPGCQDLPASAVRQIQLAHQDYQRGTFEPCERHATDVISAFPDCPDTAEAYYLRALARLQRGYRTQAMSDLRSAAQLCRRSDLATQVYLQLGLLAFEDNDYALAVAHFEKALAGSARGAAVGEAWYRYGRCLQRVGEFRRARVALQNAVKDGGSSAEAAQKLLAWPHDYFTIQCGAYSTQNGAEQAAGELRRRGLAVQVERLSYRSTLPYVVQHGHYRNYAGASAELSRARSVQHDSFIVP